jgi:hypothetical protein
MEYRLDTIAKLIAVEAMARTPAPVFPFLLPRNTLVYKGFRAGRPGTGQMLPERR